MFPLWIFESESEGHSVMSNYFFLTLTQSYPTLFFFFFLTPWIMVHGILQARILEWIAILFSRGSS